MTAPYVWADVAKGQVASSAQINELGQRVQTHLQRTGSVGVSAAATTAGTDSTTSTTYVNMAGTGSQTSFPITKVETVTRIRFEMAFTMFNASGSGPGLVFGMRINGVDYDVGKLNPTFATTRVFVDGITWTGSGIPPGIYTVQARWKATTGASAFNRDSGDWLCLSAEEVT